MIFPFKAKKKGGFIKKDHTIMLIKKPLGIFLSFPCKKYPFVDFEALIKIAHIIVTVKQNLTLVKKASLYQKKNRDKHSPVFSIVQKFYFACM